MASHRHKRDTNARLGVFSRAPRAPFIAGPLALAATLCTVGAGVLAATPSTHDAITASGDMSIQTTVDRSPVISRSGSRLDDRKDDAQDAKAEARLIKQADEKRWTTAPLNLWTEPGDRGAKVGLVDSLDRVLVTGRKAAGRAEVVVDGHLRWVTQGYLVEDKPKPEEETGAAAGVSAAPCGDPSVENGLTSEAVRLYRAVCNAFPQITSYGGWDAHGEHSSGRALDIMTSDYALGNQIAAFLQEHSAELDLYDIIWWDRIWTPVRAAEGWRGYGDHGSPTANHMDHVHASTNG